MNAAVCDPHFLVRGTAAVAVERAGAAAVPHIIQACRNRSDWHLDGVQALIGCLGSHANNTELGRLEAGRILVDVLCNTSPVVPHRWVRLAHSAARLVTSITLCGAMAQILADGRPLGYALSLAVTLAAAAGLATRSLLSWVLVSFYSRDERPRLYASAAQALVNLRDRRALPAMIHLAFDAPLRPSRRYARGVLRSLLPQVSASDAALFAAADWDAIRQAFAFRLDAELTVALLHVVELAGGVTFARPVQWVAWRHRSGEVRAHAARTLAALETRHQQALLADNLLRAAAAPAATANQMLRAALPATDLQAEQLVRAVRSDEATASAPRPVGATKPISTLERSGRSHHSMP